MQTARPMISLADYLEEKSETQAAFAARAGLSDSTLSRLLAGKSPPSPEVVERVHKATGGKVTANDLFGAWRSLQAPPPKPARPKRRRNGDARDAA